MMRFVLVAARSGRDCPCRRSIFYRYFCEGRASDSTEELPDMSSARSNGAQDCYLPGNAAADYRPLNAAKLIPAGYDIVFTG